MKMRKSLNKRQEGIVDYFKSICPLKDDRLWSTIIYDEGVIRFFPTFHCNEDNEKTILKTIRKVAIKFDKYVI